MQVTGPIHLEGVLEALEGIKPRLVELNISINLDAHKQELQCEASVRSALLLF